MTYIKDSAKIPHTFCKFLDISLKSYYELPKNATWSDPKMSPDRQFIAAKCTSSYPEEESVYIWNSNMSKGQKPLFIYTHSSILSYEFCPISSNILIIYFDKEPAYYNCKNGLKICDLPLNERKMIKTICLSFSAQGRYFGLGTRNNFFIWDIIQKQLLKCVSDLSPKKHIRDEYLVSIDTDNYLNIRNISKEKEILFHLKIKNIKNPDEILCCSLQTSSMNFYYATKNGIFLININTDNYEEKINFDNSEQRYVTISNDCKKFFSTDYSNLNFWEEKKGCTLTIKHEPFSCISYSIDSDLLITITANTISAKSISSYGQSPDLFTIYTDANPKKIMNFQYTMNNLQVICQLDENNIALYDCISGEVIKKWYHKHKNGYKSISLTPFNSGMTLMAIKLSTSLIEIYDYSKGIPIRELVDFNCYSTTFDLNGKILAAGAFRSEECARVWNLDQMDVYISFNVKNEMEAKQVSVCIVESKNYLICIWEYSQLHLYDMKNGNLIKLFHTEETFSTINDINYSNYGGLIIVHGKIITDNKASLRSTKDETECCAMIYNCNEDKVMIINRNTYIEMNNNDNYIVYDCWNRKKNEHNLYLNKIMVGGQFESVIISEIDAEHFKILPDSKHFYMVCKNTKVKEFNYTVHEINDGEMIAKIIYKHKDEHFSVIDLTMDDKYNFLFRRIMFDKMGT